MPTDTLWKEKWITLIHEQNYNEAIELLNLHAGQNRTSPSTALKMKAVESIKMSLRADQKRFEWVAMALADHYQPTAKEIATQLLIDLYEELPQIVSEKLRILADDSDWEVREWAASACGTLLINHFTALYTIMKAWTADPSPNVRRAASLSVKYACKKRKEEWAEPLLDLISPLLIDNDPYVKKNLGPFAIGDGLLRAYPDQTLNRVNQWIHIDNGEARWNIAKIFTTAQGAKNADRALPVLEILINDERPIVKRALKSALNNLQKRRPEVYNFLACKASKSY
ncbi:MAG: HEAT repeat domain-containing protein [Tuberibacillus sp.]